MRVLLIEDEERDAKDAKVILEQADPGVEVVHVRSRDAAFEAITPKAEFDLLICDIRIPPQDGGLDADERHGLAVHARGRKVLPGVPQLFLTGFATPRNVREQLGRGGVAECFGRADWLMVQLAIKDTPDELRSFINRAIAGDAALGQRIAVSGASTSRDMAIAVRFCGERVGAVAAEVFAASGLSNAEVARVVFRDANDHIVGSNYLKVESHDGATGEQRAFDTYVPTMLRPGLFAPALQPITTGLRTKACLVSTVADPHSLNIFDLLASDSPRAVEAVRQVFLGMAPWKGRRDRLEMSIGELRRSFVPDEVVRRWGILPDAGFEAQKIAFSTCVNHGDLHAENLLVDSDDRPVMIDFGDTGIGPAVRDPLTLELSILLHRNGIARSADWPDTETLANWMDLGAYVDRCPWRAFVVACREESLDRGSEAEVAAFAYAHALRHLKYPDREPELVSAMVGGIVAWFSRL